MRAHLAEVAVVADVIADAVLFDVAPFHGLSGNALDFAEGLEDGTGISFAAAEVVHLRDPGSLSELEHEAGDILGVDIVADLLALVAEDLVLAILEIALDQVAEEPV